ncbi:putative retrotransposon hot spot protein 4 (RHS4) [Trypanosoma vivax]|uniref:Retrotransposon hot spot protein N-terminal domain-containing protein n=1 Tax=Trypanosoma vivax (strain Y486) TaxID=1055687 RepID=F9WNN3_TRYVY|nr:hypothetical protein TRVL_10295 [Trypanosoma vivax]KAH8615886.1 putative retrotransposon hot spot protein 4 (RHS4) [Trypanosoma vivax]CCD19153.1 hypothetical protein, conserved in T. vivax [Trypanosoma vivax Y486]|eukprot:CCD19153.1 hypothetical protein, conserved in T. vivax [Trypanosoma vivax Y486]
MAGRKRVGRKNEGGGAGEPPSTRVRLESVLAPRWTLSSSVRDVLMGGAPSDVLLRYFLKIVGQRGAGINGDVGMDAVICEPEFYIPDADVRRRVLSLSACRTHALVYRVVPLLEGKGITSVLQWGGSDENAGAKREVRDELADDMLWNMTCGLLDDAFYAANGADARERFERERFEKERIERERVENARSVVVEVIHGAFESVVNASWSHVMSGVACNPLGMCVVDGRPKRVWRDAEVNKTPLQFPTENVDATRGDGLELLVLTSKKEWPYTLFGTHATANNTPSQMMHGTDVAV